ncbi:MAG: zinc ribbon domain-containing protein, partial [Actinobacteria bacterium]|nr:zinc ribbon domain-containing protein [Actinomycetota bacterium]
NGRGLTTSTGRPWSAASFRSLLLQRRLCGQREYAGQVVARGEWPAILDDATCARLRTLLTDPARRSARPARRYLLSGLIRCSKCGSRMRSTQPGGKRKYGCPPRPDGCNGTTILADGCEVEVVGRALHVLDSPAVKEALSPGSVADDDALVSEIDADEALLAELAADYAARRITRGEWLIARDAIEVRLEGARVRLAPRGRTLELPDDLANRWDQLPFYERRAVLGEIVERVTISPARVRGRFEPERIQVRWKV